jgi:ATP-dependent RNA helicase RhlE
LKKLLQIFKKSTSSESLANYEDQKEKNSPAAPLPGRDQSPPKVPTVTFSDLGLHAAISRAVAEEGYTSPTPIQAAAIPHIIPGRDLLGCAQTGTGKTAAFALPILHNLLKIPRTRSDGVGALVLTPTRELALQIAESFQVYGRHLPLRTVVVYGGVGLEPQKRALASSPDILIATPGRLLDLRQQGAVDVRNLSIFVLDEADRMLDMGFIHDVKKVINFIPRQRQTLLFSATMPPAIQDLAMSILKNPARVEVAPVSSTSERVDQSVYFVDRLNKRHLLLHVLKHEPVTRGLVFTRTKAIANRVTAFLNDNDFTAEAIHGNKSQNARQRALDNFKAGRTKILVASDLAARGIDVEEISHVINYDLPNVAETYVHRIGRTGRAFASGRALSFCDAEEKEYLTAIEKLTRIKVPVITDHPYVGVITSQEASLAAKSARGSQVQRGANHRRPERPAAQGRANPGIVSGKAPESQNQPQKSGRRRRRRKAPRPAP